MFTAQNPLVEYILEFILKQAIQHGPDLVREIKKRAKQTRKISTHVSKAELVNRESERRAIQTSLEDIPRLRILYFVGEGGAGKTCLLQNAESIIKNHGKSKLPLRWSGLIDLYHTEFHSVTAIQQTIIQGLDPTREFFQRYDQAQGRFEQLLAEGLVGPIIEEERQKLNDIFFEEYRTLARKYRPVVVFDTLESLTHESDWVEALCKLESTPVASRDWIIQQVTRFENSVVLMAGRPQPVLQSALEKENNAYPGQLEIIELRGLTREDTRQLLAMLLKGTPASLKHLMESADQLWQVTRGLPVQLALAVDLASHGRFITQENLGDGDTSGIWGQHLVKELFSTDNPDTRLFFLLGLARKGMTADLLHYLEPERSKADCQQQLEHLRTTSVVKARTERGELFLHDALYELFDTYFLPEANLDNYYERLADYYRAKHSRGEQDNGQRSQTATSLLHYELQRNPRNAFDSVYLHLRERALKGHELEFDLQLRDELLRFVRNSTVTNSQTADNILTQAEVDRDGVVRWIKRYLVQSYYQQAIRIAETILALGPYQNTVQSSDLANLQSNLSQKQQEYTRSILNTAEPFFWGQLLTYYCEALIYVGAPELEVYQILKQANALLNNTQMKFRLSMNWLRERILGRVNDRLGYLYRSNGHYGNALVSYKNAIPEYRILEIVDEEAATLNNLSFILALLGDTYQAMNYANQALALRQQLKQQYPLALSHNTRGLIYSLQGQYELGQKESRLALNIFEELETPRGIGLACNALGYILRRQGESWKTEKYTPDQAIQYFRQSIGYFERAEKVFLKQISEPIRLWESYNEQGSLYREWGNLLERRDNAKDAQKLYADAIESQLKALEIAQQHGMRFQEADTYDDLAKVSWDQGDEKKANYWLRRARSLVPKEYTMNLNPKSKKSPPVGEAYWLILGKIHLQEGTWAIKSLTKGRLSKRKYWGYTQSAIHKFALAAHYFERYWPATSANQLRFQFMAEQILHLGMPVREIRRALKLEGTRHKVNVSAFLKTFPSRSVK